MGGVVRLGGRRWKGGLSQARPGQRWPVSRWPGSPVQGGQGVQVVPWSGENKCNDKNPISGEKLTENQVIYSTYQLKIWLSPWVQNRIIRWNLYHKAIFSTSSNTKWKDNRSALDETLCLLGILKTGEGGSAMNWIETSLNPFANFEDIWKQLQDE